MYGVADSTYDGMKQEVPRFGWKMFSFGERVVEVAAPRSLGWGRGKMENTRCDAMSLATEGAQNDTKVAQRVRTFVIIEQS